MYALVAVLGGADATPAYLGFTMAGHTLGRATLVGTAETPAG